MQDYGSKTNTYFGNPRVDYVGLLPENPAARVLELGCGSGATGALALREGKCGTYVGIELFEPMARQASAVLTEVHIGDVESMPLPYSEGHFDALIMSEVLEHLVDPQAALRKLVPLVRAGGRIFASSPNVSHHRIIRQLLKGRFDYADSGAMDRTHLRWFTPRTFTALLDAAGVSCDWIGPYGELSPRDGRIARILGPRLRHLMWYQVNFHGHRRGPAEAAG